MDAQWHREEIAGVQFAELGDRLAIRATVSQALRMAFVFYFLGGLFVTAVLVVARAVRPESARTAALLAFGIVAIWIVGMVASGLRPLFVNRHTRRTMRGKTERDLSNVVTIRPKGDGAIFLRAYRADGSSTAFADHVAFSNPHDAQRAADLVNAFLGLDTVSQR